MSNESSEEPKVLMRLVENGVERVATNGDALRMFEQMNSQMVKMLLEQESEAVKAQRASLRNGVLAWAIFWLSGSLLYHYDVVRGNVALAALRGATMAVALCTIYLATRTWRALDRDAKDARANRIRFQARVETVLAEMRAAVDSDGVPAPPIDSQSSPAAPTASAAAPDHSEREPGH